MIRDWTSRKCGSIGSPYMGKGKLRAFLKKPFAKRAGELLNLSRNKLWILTGMLTGHCHLKGHLLKLGLVISPECNRCKQTSETASHIHCDRKPLATLRYRHLDHHFMKQGDFEDISVSMILHSAQGVGLLTGCT